MPPPRRPSTSRQRAGPAPGSAAQTARQQPAAAPATATAVLSEQEERSLALAARLPQSPRIRDDEHFTNWDEDDRIGRRDDPYIPAGAESDDDDPDGPFSIARTDSERQHTATATTTAPDDDQPPPYADHRRFHKATATTPIRHTAIIVSLILALAASTAALTLPSTPIRLLLAAIHAALIAHATYRLS